MTKLVCARTSELLEVTFTFSLCVCACFSEGKQNIEFINMFNKYQTNFQYIYQDLGYIKCYSPLLVLCAHVCSM